VCCCTVAETEESSAVSSGEVSSSHRKSSVAVQPPLKKKSRLDGAVDVNSPGIQKLIRAKSAHMSLVDEVCIILYGFQ